MKRIYVGNLPYSCSEEDLKNIFASYEPSSVKLIIDHESGRSKGFGFVDIDSNDLADKAIAELDKKVVDGKELTVNEARPQKKRDNNRSFSKPRRGGGGFR